MRPRKKWDFGVSRAELAGDGGCAAIAGEMGLRLPVALLLRNRGCTTAKQAEAYLTKKEEYIHDPFEMKDMDRAVKRIMDALRDGEKICVYGDYDVDGVTAVTVLVTYLREKGASVTYYIPSRSGDGYGVSDNAVRNLAAEGTDLIITVDTGITAGAEVETGRELGVDFIITDHHTCLDPLPEAEAVVNPHRPDCAYPFKELAGVGVAFKLICALEIGLCPGRDAWECVLDLSGRYCDLVALGTIADVMPVTDENRLIVSYGLHLINNTGSVGLSELIEAAKAESKSQMKRKITASYVGFTLAPRLNAAGRIREASAAVELLMTKDREEAAELAARLCEINRERQNEENRIAEEANEKLIRNPELLNSPVLVIDDDNWHGGIIGIVASRLTEKYSKPTILISFEGSENGETGKGSGRSIKGVNLVNSLAACSDILEKFGGHELAAGLTVKRENLEKLRKRLSETVHISEEQMESQSAVSAECELGGYDLEVELVDQIFELEPFGTGNPTPVFVSRGARVEDVTEVGDGKHTRFTLMLDGRKVTAMGFRRRMADLDIFPGDTVDVMYTLDINEFQNHRNVQMVIKDIRITDSEWEREVREEKVYRLMEKETPEGDPGFGGASPASEVPSRSDFAAVYRTLVREVNAGNPSQSIRSVRYLLAGSGIRASYAKIRYVIEILKDLKLVTALKDSIDPDRAEYEIPRAEGKKDLETSGIYSRILADYCQGKMQ